LHFLDRISQTFHHKLRHPIKFSLLQWKVGNSYLSISKLEASTHCPLVTTFFHICHLYQLFAAILLP
jgi:hypothetical protein